MTHENDLSAWRPRASSSGYYWLCSQRAAYDRAVSEGLVDSSLRDDQGPKAYAALGTLIHFRLQSGMRAKFPGPERDFAPTEDERAQALTLFGGDPGRLDKAVDGAARAALAHVPKLPEGVHWLAEPTVDGGPLVPPGHIDLIASDRSIIVDLKTTTKKPTKMKRAALIQLGSYCLSTGVKVARAIYVDSVGGGSWCTPIDVDFSDGKEASLILDMIPKLVAYWRGPTLYDTAYPGPMDDSCGDDFCPYTKVCRDAIVPKAAACFNRKPEYGLGGLTL